MLSNYGFEKYIFISNLCFVPLPKGFVNEMLETWFSTQKDNINKREIEKTSIFHQKYLE